MKFLLEWSSMAVSSIHMLLTFVIGDQLKIAIRYCFDLLLEDF